MITLVYRAKLGFITQKISIEVQKIEYSLLKTYDIVLTKFLFQDSL